jgi:hypothetical protein
MAIADRELRTTTDVEALFAEARRRRSRRRLAGVVVALILAGSVTAGVTIGGSHHGVPLTGKRDHPAAAARRASVKSLLPPAPLAWIDTGSQLQIGDLATGTRRIGPATDSSPSAPLVSAGGRLYWSDFGQNVAPIREYVLATGKIGYLARGEAVFAAADGRHLYIVAGTTRLIELRGNGSGPPTLLNVPAGWHISGNLAVQWDGTVAGGIIVYTRIDQDYHQTLSTREGI